MADDPQGTREPGGTGPSSMSGIAPAPSVPTARPASSLLSYFGKDPKRQNAAASGSSLAPAPAPGAKGKVKRTKAAAPDQARLGTVSREGSSSVAGWALDKVNVKEADSETRPKAKARKKASKVDEGEEAERKEMAKRSKVDKGKSKAAAGPLKAGQNAGNGLYELSDGEGEKLDGVAAIPDVMRSDASDVRPPQHTKLVHPEPRSSEGKRKRSHHHPQERAQPSLSLPSSSYPSSQASNHPSTLLGSSPPTITLSSSTESSDEELFKLNTRAEKTPRSTPSLTFPLFSRSSSTTSKGASQDDAIDIEDSPQKSRPRTIINLAESPQAKADSGGGKAVFAAERKGIHGFFGKKQAAPLVPVPNEGTSITQAVADNAKPPLKNKVHSFFQAGPKGVPGKVVDGWGGDRKMGDEWPAPLPGGKWPSHLGYSDLPIGPLGRLRKRRRSSPPPAPPIDYYFARPQTTAQPILPPSHHRPPVLAPAPATIDHPAVRSVSRRPLQANQETWCERYRPLNASQVVGNEGEATYLRDWLQLLSVGHDGASASTAKVTRRVPRQSALLLDGWIVDDINSFSDDEDGNNLDEAYPDHIPFQPFEDPPSALDPRPSSYPAFEGRLANTILLSGPNGCGKSAAVYAVAEELGWEVFEVYPGTGRRTGSNLMSLVGDVGRNHVIAGKGKGKVTPKKAKGTLAPEVGKSKSAAGSFFKSVAVAAAAKPVVAAVAATLGKGGMGGVARKRANQLPPSSQGSQDDPMRLDDSDDDLQLLTEEPEVEVDILEDRKHGFRETLILLDEADLLFEEEGSFWPSVIALIAESRRPVVITCNDPERIPIASLPLQAILEFEPPPRDLAISLLAAIATHESLPQFDIPTLYDSCLSCSIDLLAQPTPLVPNGHEPIPSFDLRCAITQMQLDRGTCGLPNGPDPAETNLGLEDTCKNLELMSFVDAWVGPRSWALREIHEIDRYSDSPDELLGVHVLPKPEAHPDWIALPAFSAEQEMSEYLFTLTPTIPSNFSSESLGLIQTTHIRALLPLLDPLIPLNSNLLPHSSLFTDYIPILRAIVLTDDLLEMAEEATLASGGERINRKTGRPIRTVTGWLKGKEEGGYVRYLMEAGKEGEAVVRDIRLGSGDASGL